MLTKVWLSSSIISLQYHTSGIEQNTNLSKISSVWSIVWQWVQRTEKNVPNTAFFDGEYTKAIVYM